MSLIQWQVPATASEVTSWETDPDLSAALIGYSLNYGRSALHQPPGPLTATVSLARTGTPPEIGDRFRLRVGADLLPPGTPPAAATRFTGEVTDVEADPLGGTYTVTAVGRYGRRSRVPVRLVGPTRRPDVDAIAVLAALAGAVLADLPAETGRPLVAVPSDPAPLGATLDKITAGTGALLVEQRNGLLSYVPADARRGTTPAATLGPDQILTGLRWTKRGGDVVNAATVKLADGTSVEVRDDHSIATRGEYATSVETLLADPDAAWSTATLLVARRRTPAYQLPALGVDLLHSPTPAPAPALLGATVGTRLALRDLPPPTPGEPLDLDVFVEGVAETLTLAAGIRPAPQAPRRLSWRLSLLVSDVAVAGLGIRWADVPVEVTWADVDPDVDWLDTAGMETATPLT